jgi:Ca2+-binding EF-hand superfamily protein
MSLGKTGTSGYYDQYEALLDEFEETGAADALHRMFRLLDLDGDGRVSKEELLAFYRTREQEREATKATRSFFKLGDTNQDGFLDETEFLSLFTRTSNIDLDEKALSPADIECKRLLDTYEESRDDQLLHRCFQLLDLNHDGVVSKSELKASYLCRGRSMDDAARIIMQLGDTNQDGVLSVEEFVQLIKQSLH